MKRLTRLLFGAGVIVLSLAGCKEYRTEYSDIKKENAVVSEKVHINAYTTFIPMKVGKSTMVMPISHPEVNDIHFDGDIDFEINNKEIFDQFNEGEGVEVSYKERYLLTYYDTDKDGKKELLNEELNGYEFVNAVRPSK